MAASDQTPFTARDDGITVAVRVTPKASRTKIIGLVRDADDRSHLAVAVSAPPEDGKANVAVVKLLAREWHLAKSAITVATGAASRRKSLHIAGDPDRLLLDLTDWAADIG